MGSEQNIDTLNIQINAKAEKNSDGIDKMAEAIKRLRDSVNSTTGGLGAISAAFNRLDESVGKLKGKSGTVSSIVNSFKKLNDLDVGRTASQVNNLAKSMQSLNNMDSGLKQVISDLAQLSRSGSGNASMEALKLQAQAAKAQATVDKSALQSAKAQEGLKALNDRNRAIAESAKYATEQENSLNDAVNRAMQKYNAQFRQSNSSEAALAADAELARQNASSKVGPTNLATSITDLKKAMGEVGAVSTTATTKVSTGASQATSFVDKLRNSFMSADEKASGFGKSAKSAFAMQNFYGSYFIIRKVADTMAGFITNINSYVENMNLFSVAMGKSAESGQKLSDSLQSVLGVDAGEADRYMGVFAQLESSFGVTSKQTEVMSKNLTELGYDIASYYNISTSQAFTKLQSGMTGQTAALRQLGIDTSKARLQEELYNMGLKEKVTDLSQADKSLLRYKAIMEQTTNAQGDMGRTLNTPANSLRVLQAQLTITGRAIGSIFVPALQAVLPWVTAFVEVIGEGATALASFLGFKMPTIDYSSLKPMNTNVSDDINAADTGVKNIGKDAKESSKEMKSLIGGFDELNILSTSKESSTKKKSDSGTGGNILGGLDLPQYDALNGAVSNKVDALKQKIKDFLEAFRNDPLTTFSQALWGVNSVFGDLFKMLTKCDYADLLNGISAACVAFGLTKNPILALAIGAIVTALSHIMPQKAKIEMLTGTLTALGGALMLSAFTGMNFKLAFAISSLVTSGLIQLVGKTAAISTLSGVIVGLGTAFAAYRLTGNLPLGIAIGVVTGGVAAMSVQFGHMEVAASLLVGLSTALIAIKKGVEFRSSILLGLGTFVISIGNLADVGPAAKIALDGIGLGLVTVGLALNTGLGPMGLVIAGVAGAIAGIAVGIAQVKRADEEADLKKRFGDITLSMDDCKKMADRLTTTPYTVKVSAAISAEKDLENIKSTLSTDIEKLNEMNWKISVGYKLDAGEQDEYKNDIDAFVKDAKDYVTKQHYSVDLNIQAAFYGHEDVSKALSDASNSQYAGVEKQLNDYGKQLTELIGKGFKDGVPIKQDEIMAVEKKMQEAIQQVADAKYEAKLKTLTADYGKVKITADSFKNLQKELNSASQEKINNAKTVRINAIAEAQMLLKEGAMYKGHKMTAKDLQDVVNVATDTFNKQQLEIHIKDVNVSMDTLNTAYKSALDAAAQRMQETGNFEQIKVAVGGGFDNAIKEASAAVGSSFESAGLKGNSDLKEMIDSIKPSENDLRSTAETCKKAGKSFPDGLLKGINDTEKLKALYGDADGINYELGLKFSTDKSFLNTLATSQGAGKKITGYMREGLTNNTTVKALKDSAGKTVSWICDAQGHKLVEVTPTMKKNFTDMGVNTGSWIASGATNKNTTSKVQSATSSLVNSGTTAARKASADSKKDMQNVGKSWGENLWDGLKNAWDEIVAWWTGKKLPTKSSTSSGEAGITVMLNGWGKEKGTTYHTGGPAIVNDQQGSLYREMIAEPNGRMYIPYGRNVLIPNLPRGSKVFTATQTRNMFPHYASGVGNSETVSVSSTAIPTADLGKLNDAVEQASIKRKKILDDEIAYVKAQWNTFSAEMFKNVDKAVTDLAADMQKIKDDSAAKWDSISQYTEQRLSAVSATSLKQFGLVYTYESQFFGKAQTDSEKRADDMQSHISSRFKSASDNAKSYFNTLASGISNYMSSANTSVDKYSKQIANNISSRIGGAINGVVVGINSVLSAVGSGTKVAKIAIPTYKYGTGRHPGGAAIVNDQNGSTYRELVQLPDGRMFIPKGRNVLIPDLPRGSAVMPAAQTRKLFPHYAAGVGDFFGTSAEDMKKRLIDYIFATKDPQKILKTAVDSSTQKQAINEPWMSLETNAVKYLTNMSADALQGLIKKFVEQSNGTAEALIRVAASQVGTTDPSKYWKEFGSAGDAWCDEFVSWCLKHSGVKEGFGAYVPDTMAWYKQRNRWTDTPERGDLVFYDWNGDKTPDHIGIVESIAKGFINTIEGNTSGSHGDTGVFKKQRMMDSEILGYALPMFTGAAGYGANFTGSGVERWRSLASQALQMTGHYSAHNVDLLLRQMNTESSGQVNPADYKDINYYMGHPSKGLMQLIPETFASYAMPGHNSDILDPLSNILAAIRYTWSRYGGPDGVWGEGHGYSDGVGKIRWHKDGGVINSPTPLDYGGEAGPERIVPLSEDSEWIERVAEATAVKTEEHNNSEGNSEFFSMLRMVVMSAIKEGEGKDGNIVLNNYMDSEPVAQVIYKIQKRDKQRGRI